MADVNPQKEIRSIARFFQRLTVITVMLALWVPFMGQLFLPAPERSCDEKRRLARWPKLDTSVESVAAWPEAVGRWQDDHLGFRQWLIESWSRFSVEVFGVSSSLMTLVGKDGWLFLNDRDAVDNYRGLAPLTPYEIDRWRRVLEERRDWLAERGIQYLLVLVPDKHLVYDEFMPDSAPRMTSIHPLQQLSQHLRNESDIEFIDLEPTMREKKNEALLYYKTDSHWNDAGAYLGYQAIHQRLAEISPQLKDTPPIRIAANAQLEKGLGLAGTLSMRDIYTESVINRPVVSPQAVDLFPHRQKDPCDGKMSGIILKTLIFETPDRSRPRALIFRDSFGNALVPYLAEDFSRSVFIWDRDVDPEAVIRENPDIVIQEIVGRFLGRRPRTLEEVRERNRRRS